MSQNDPIAGSIDPAPVPKAENVSPLEYGRPGERPVLGRIRRHGVRLAWFGSLAVLLTAGVGALGSMLLPNGRSPIAVIYFIILGLCFLAAFAASAISFFGIHSRHTALLIIPGGSLGVILGAFSVLASYYLALAWGARWN